MTPQMGDIGIQIGRRFTSGFGKLLFSGLAVTY
jgi:hypothetical protein